MKSVCAILLFLGTLLVCPSVALADSTGLALCADNTGSTPFDAPTFIAWGRAFAIPFTGGYASYPFGDYSEPELEFWELWKNGVRLLDGDGYKSFVETPKKGTSNSSYDVKWQLHSDTWPNTEVDCYREGRLTIRTGIGKRPTFRARTGSHRPITSVTHRGWGDVRTVNPSCNAVRLFPGYIDVRRGKDKWVSRKVSDVCTLQPIKRKSVSLGKGLALSYQKGDIDEDRYRHGEPTVLASARGPSRESVTLRVRGGGVTFTQKLAILRIDRPDRKIWAGTDEYRNYCVNHAKKVYAENGNYYCWKRGVDTVRVSKA